jgi:predicted metal-binding protein
VKAVDKNIVSNVFSRLLWGIIAEEVTRNYNKSVLFSMFYQEKISGHSCDICAKSITGSLYRCQTCDYDVCKNCHIEKED